MFILRAHGCDLFASESILECFEYYKKCIDSMPTGFRNIELILPNWYKGKNINTVSPVSVGNAEIHIHIHVGDK